MCLIADERIASVNYPQTVSQHRCVYICWVVNFSCAPTTWTGKTKNRVSKQSSLTMRAQRFQSSICSYPSERLCERLNFEEWMNFEDEHFECRIVKKCSFSSRVKVSSDSKKGIQESKRTLWSKMRIIHSVIQPCCVLETCENACKKGNRKLYTSLLMTPDEEENLDS